MSKAYSQVRSSKVMIIHPGPAIINALFGGPCTVIVKTVHFQPPGLSSSGLQWRLSMVHLESKFIIFVTNMFFVQPDDTQIYFRHQPSKTIYNKSFAICKYKIFCFDNPKINNRTRR